MHTFTFICRYIDGFQIHVKTRHVTVLVSVQSCCVFSVFFLVPSCWFEWSAVNSCLFECGRYCHKHVFILCGCPCNCQNNHTQVPVLTHLYVNTHSCDVSYLQSLLVSVSELKKPEPKPESKPQSNPVSKPVPKPHKAQERVSTNPLAPACSRSVASLLALNNPAASQHVGSYTTPARGQSHSSAASCCFQWIGLVLFFVCIWLL